MKQSKIIKYLLLVFTFFVNSISAQNIFEKKYDSVYYKAEKFIIAKENKVIKLFNTKGEIYSLKKYITIAEIQPNVAYQIVLGDKLKMINGEGRFDDSIKIQLSRGYCGTINRYKNSIQTRNDSTFIHFHTTHPWADPKANDEDKQAETDTTIFISKDIDIYFFNREKNVNFTENDEFVEGVKSNLYFEKTKTNKTNLLSIVITDSSVSNKYILTNIDSIYRSTYVIPYATFQPFIFSKNKLLGYYPMQTIAKYKLLSVFNNNFAAFTLPNEQKGWLDINGKEYFYK